MARNVTALVMIAVFALFSTSCSMWPTKAIQTENDYPAQERKVLSVVLTNGEVVAFSKSNPGRIWRDKVSGTVRVWVSGRAEIQGPFLLIKKRADGTVSEVTDAKGQVHYVRSVLSESRDTMVVQESGSEMRSVEIPLSDVRLITYRTTNTALTLMAVAAAGATGLLAIALYALSRD